MARLLRIELAGGFLAGLLSAVAQRQHPTDTVDLIGRSAGGVVTRLEVIDLRRWPHPVCVGVPADAGRSRR